MNLINTNTHMFFSRIRIEQESRHLYFAGGPEFRANKETRKTPDRKNTEYENKEGTDKKGPSSEDIIAAKKKLEDKQKQRKSELTKTEEGIARMRNDANIPQTANGFFGNVPQSPNGFFGKAPDNQEEPVPAPDDADQDSQSSTIEPEEPQMTTPERPDLIDPPPSPYSDGAKTKPKNPDSYGVDAPKSGRSGRGGINIINTNVNTIVSGNGHGTEAKEKPSDAEQMAKLMTLNTEYTNKLTMNFRGLSTPDIVPQEMRETMMQFKRTEVSNINRELESDGSAWRVTEGGAQSARLFFYNINKERPASLTTLMPRQQAKISALMKQSETTIKKPGARFDMKNHIQNMNNELSKEGVRTVHFEAPIDAFPTIVRLVGGASA